MVQHDRNDDDRAPLKAKKKRPKSKSLSPPMHRQKLAVMKEVSGTPVKQKMKVASWAKRGSSPPRHEHQAIINEILGSPASTKTTTTTTSSGEVPQTPKNKTQGIKKMGSPPDRKARRRVSPKRNTTNYSRSQSPGFRRVSPKRNTGNSRSRSPGFRRVSPKRNTSHSRSQSPGLRKVSPKRNNGDSQSRSPGPRLDLKRIILPPISPVTPRAEFRKAKSNGTEATSNTSNSSHSTTSRRRPPRPANLESLPLGSNSDRGGNNNAAQGHTSTRSARLDQSSAEVQESSSSTNNSDHIYPLSTFSYQRQSRPRGAGGTNRSIEAQSAATTNSSSNEAKGNLATTTVTMNKTNTIDHCHQDTTISVRKGGVLVNPEEEGEEERGSTASWIGHQRKLPFSNDSDSDDLDLLPDVEFSRSSTGPPPPTFTMTDRGMDKFPNDKWWHKCLRHFRILPPTRHEGRTRRRVRYLIWATLILDLLVAIVSIATFGGTVTMCCGVAIMASVPGIDWNLFMNVVSYIYLMGILIEIHPVVREGPIPWNLLNPILGSILSFAVFVDDSKAEAICIWVMELVTVILELWTYLKLRKLYKREERRIDRISANIESERRSDIEKSFRKNAFKRERRNLQMEHSNSTKKLQYHFVGVVVNFGLVCLTLLLMIMVARGGGMCFVGGDGLDLFNADQRARCNLCADDSNGWNDKCFICDDKDEPKQCYYPYF
eukprot:scaffold276_cov132-Cylindrotheca_fusiformis.AAC.14